MLWKFVYNLGEQSETKEFKKIMDSQTKSKTKNLKTISIQVRKKK